MLHNKSEIFLVFFPITSSASMLSDRTVLLYTNFYEVRRRLENSKVFVKKKFFTFEGGASGAGYRNESYVREMR